MMGAAGHGIPPGTVLTHYFQYRISGCKDLPIEVDVAKILQQWMKDKFRVCSHGSLHTIPIPVGRMPQLAKRKWLRSGLAALPPDNRRRRQRHVRPGSLPPVALFDSSP
jgi:hypothetical protein